MYLYECCDPVAKEYYYVNKRIEKKSIVATLKPIFLRFAFLQFHEHCDIQIDITTWVFMLKAKWKQIWAAKKILYNIDKITPNPIRPLFSWF